MLDDCKLNQEEKKLGKRKKERKKWKYCFTQLFLIKETHVVRIVLRTQIITLTILRTVVVIIDCISIIE